jgi:Protein of unknown function (DUF3551)
MLRSLITVLSAIAVVAIVGALSPAAAAARYCLQGRHFGYPGNCQFSTLQQCRAAASGTASHCGVNPRYAFARQRPVHQ